MTVAINLFGVGGPPNQPHNYCTMLASVAGTVGWSLLDPGTTLIATTGVPGWYSGDNDYPFAAYQTGFAEGGLDFTSATINNGDKVTLNDGTSVVDFTFKTGTAPNQTDVLIGATQAETVANLISRINGYVGTFNNFTITASASPLSSYVVLLRNDAVGGGTKNSTIDKTGLSGIVYYGMVGGGPPVWQHPPGIVPTIKRDCFVLGGLAAPTVLLSPTERLIAPVSHLLGSNPLSYQQPYSAIIGGALVDIDSGPAGTGLWQIEGAATDFEISATASLLGSDPVTIPPLGSDTWPRVAGGTSIQLTVSSTSSLDGKTIAIRNFDNGLLKTFELDTNGSVSGSNIKVNVSGLTKAQVAAAIVTAILANTSLFAPPCWLVFASSDSATNPVITIWTPYTLLSPSSFVVLTGFSGQITAAAPSTSTASVSSGSASASGGLVDVVTLGEILTASDALFGALRFAPRTPLSRDVVAEITGARPIFPILIYEIVSNIEEVVLTHHASGTVTLNDVPLDGETVTIGDGVVSRIFEFDDDDTVSAGNIAVPLNDGDGNPLDKEGVADSLRLVVDDSVLTMDTRVGFVTGSVTVNTQPDDGDIVELTNAHGTFTYEFDNDDSVTLGNIAVPIGGSLGATVSNLSGVIGGAAATASVVFSDIPTSGDSITIDDGHGSGGVIFTFASLATSITTIRIGTDLLKTLDYAIASINAHPIGVKATHNGIDTLLLTQKYVDTFGNVMLYTSGATMTPSGFSGGVDPSGISIQTFIIGNTVKLGNGVEEPLTVVTTSSHLSIVDPAATVSLENTTPGPAGNVEITTDSSVVSVVGMLNGDEPEFIREVGKPFLVAETFEGSPADPLTSLGARPNFIGDVVLTYPHIPPPSFVTTDTTSITIAPYNTGQQQSASILIVSNPTNGKVVTIRDDRHPAVTFEFRTGGLPSPGNIPVAVGGTVSDTAEALTTAVNNVGNTLAVTATSSGAQIKIVLDAVPEVRFRAPEEYEVIFYLGGGVSRWQPHERDDLTQGWHWAPYRTDTERSMDAMEVFDLFDPAGAYRHYGRLVGLLSRQVMYDNDRLLECADPRRAPVAMLPTLAASLGTTLPPNLTVREQRRRLRGFGALMKQKGTPAGITSALALLGYSGYGKHVFAKTPNNGPSLTLPTGITATSSEATTTTGQALNVVLHINALPAASSILTLDDDVNTPINFTFGPGVGEISIAGSPADVASRLYTALQAASPLLLSGVTLGADPVSPIITFTLGSYPGYIEVDFDTVGDALPVAGDYVPTAQVAIHLNDITGAPLPTITDDIKQSVAEFLRTHVLPSHVRIKYFVTDL